MPHHAFGIEMPSLKNGLGPYALNDMLYRLWAAGQGGLKTSLLLAVRCDVPWAAEVQRTAREVLELPWHTFCCSCCCKMNANVAENRYKFDTLWVQN